MGLYRFLLTLLVVLFLASCSAPSKRDDEPRVSQPGTSSPSVIDHKVDYIKKAEQVFAQTGSLTQRNEWLIKEIESLQQQGNCVKSLKLLQILLPELTDTRQLNIARLIYSECLVTIDTPEANEQAQLAMSEIKLFSGYEQRVYALQATLYSQQQAWLKASQALLRSSMDEPAKSQQIWQWLQHLNSAELRKAQKIHPQLQAWLELSLIVHTYGLQPQQLITQVANWQNRHPQHVLANALPAEISLALAQQPLKATNIAVLLPLTGRLATQGLALKEGILAAYLANLSATKLTEQTSYSADMPKSTGTFLTGQEDLQVSTPAYQKLRFFDAALKTPEQLNALVADYDFVLGPLLKESITGLTAILPEDKVMLALNRTDSDTIKPNTLPDTNKQFEMAPKEHYFFALAPEDEAEQLASYIKHKGYQRPIIFTANNSVTSRMTDAFIAKWTEGSAVLRIPDVAVFSDSKNMREQAESLLDVAQSKARIRQMENVADVELFSVERNRQDVDVIILFANPEQTELLNPIIEASLSPFAAQSLAVFASSRSYSLELSKNSLRDLRNLTFSDMPWMLPAHPWTDLANQTSELWPQRQDSLLRLFAMGYDAYELIANLRLLTLLPQVSKQGLTGELNVAENGVLHRHLPLAKIIQDRVTVLAVD
ncbi:penicillin-binding protein activator [Paraglaciecola sp.]|uniref:penicillin-binding protein activator n=1 Tax=Paraglaciecola sp. TaxID=1920173 RepID=UPI0030F3B051